MKKISIFAIATILTVNLNADFLGTLQKNTSIGNINVGNLGNVSSLGNFGNISDVISKYKEYGVDQVLSYGSDYILNNEALGEWWSKNSTFATGTMELCYEYSPQANTSINGDICSILNNTNVDPCSALPDQMGPYKKLSSNDRLKKQLPLKDWCNSISGKTKKVTAEKASKMLGLSGKEKAAVVDAKFNSEEKSKEEKKAANALVQFKDQVKADNDTYAAKVISLEKQGKGNVVRNEIKKLSKNTDELDEKTLNKLDNQIVFSDLKEYEDDLNSKANSDYEVNRKLFDFNNHVKSAQLQFNSLNTQQKTYSDKISYIDKYIDDDKNGLRNKFYKWAEQRAEEEIMYDVPKKLDNYYSVFNEKILLSNTDYSGQDKKTQISLINNDIAKQQFYEKEVMLKWKKIADAKADELKNLLIKNAIASEQFDRTAAMNRIYQLISPQSN
jgi:hypothetical protein